jgi:hypothetical protein
VGVGAAGADPKAVGLARRFVLERDQELERTRDRPCHGSRFRIDGTVIDGPAVRGLERHELPGAGRR